MNLIRYSPADLSPKFHENRTLLGRVDLILGARSQQDLKLGQLALVPLEFRETSEGICASEHLRFRQGIFDNCCQSKDLADFHNLQGRLEP